MFELTQEHIDEIVFYMEDQSGDFVINKETGKIINRAQGVQAGGVTFDSGAYTSLPKWTPSDGFALMKSFTATLNNPPARKALSAALCKGKGVFRAFKSALKEYPEVEKVWLFYRESGLKKSIYPWYAGLCEEEAAGVIGGEPEETEELVNEDFQFTVLNDARHLEVIACNLSDKKAGLISAKKCEAEQDAPLVIENLFVEEAFRGLGLGAALLKKLIAENPRADLSIDLPAQSADFARALLREGFAPSMTRYTRKAKRG